MKGVVSLDLHTITGFIAAGTASAALLISLGTLIYNHLRRRAEGRLATAMEDDELLRLRIVTIKRVSGYDAVNIVVQNRSSLPVQINGPQFEFRGICSKQQVGTFFSQPRLQSKDTFDYPAEFPGIDANTIMKQKEEVRLIDIS